jgi:serine/threonine-protein kinase HipA
MAVGREGRQISRANLLSHHAHFALTREQAEQLLEEVAGWKQLSWWR